MYKFYSKYSSLSTPKKAAIWYTLCNILQKGIAFLVVPIYIRLLTPAEYGTYVTFIAWKDIIIIFATLNLYCGVFTKAMVDFEDDRDKYTSSIQMLSTLLTLGLFIIYLFHPNFWENILDINKVNILLLFGYFITNPAFSFWLVRQRVEYKYVQMVLVTLFASILTPVVCVFLLYSTDCGVQILITGFLIVQIIFGTFFYIKNFIKGRSLFIWHYWKFALKYNIPLIPHYLSLIVLGQVDRIMIKTFVGSKEAGIYSLAYQISQSMTIITGAINASFVPWIYYRLKIKDYISIKNVANKLCVFVCASVFFIMLVSPEVIRFIGTSEYYHASFIIPLTAVGVYLGFCYGLFANIEFYYSATTFVMIASLFVGVVKFCLNYVMLPKFGYMSAGYTDVICYILFVLSHCIFMRKVLRKNNICQNVYDLRLIFLSIIILIIIMVISIIIQDFNYIRYTLALLIMGSLIYYRKSIFKLLKN